ncbi:MAG TPA: hypothetical protein VHB20_14685 [Verrucomicrobiae bacterium]|jgi:hypothetical protein|nr:hypothetical protein [Verrucomicrobiae bacterium]
MNIGSTLARQKLTGRLYFARTGFALVDLGNAELFKEAGKVDRGQQLTRRGGQIVVSHEEPAKIDWRWKVKLDEKSGEALRLLTLATASSFTTPTTNAAQSNCGAAGDVLAPGQVWLPTVITANWPLLNLNAGAGSFIVVSCNATTYTLNTDYTVDPATGAITALNLLGDGVHQLHATVKALAYTASKYTLLSESFVRGSSQINLFDQNDELFINQGALNTGADPGQPIGAPGFIIHAGTSYALGVYQIANFQLKSAASGDTSNAAPLYTAGVDYTYNPATGVITALSDLGQFHLPGDQLLWFGSAPALKTYGNIAPREIILLPSAELAATEWPEDDGQKWEGFTLDLAGLIAPVVQSRE